MVQDLIPTLHCLHHSAAFRVLWALEELKALNAWTGSGGAEESIPARKIAHPRSRRADKRDEPLPVFQLQPGVLTEAQLILHFLSDEYGNGVWEPESKENERRDTFFQAFATMTLSPWLDMIVTLESLLMALPFGLSGLMRLIIGPLISIFKGGLPVFFDLLETSLTDEKPWFSGAKFGLADFNMSFSIDAASQRGYIDPKKYPKLTEWSSKIRSREGYITAVKECGGYDLKTYGMK
ncbi:unnamed protein product [Clonostachys rosea]|uniref:GST C-terminal domain-containing protein n=1 Tax=Bionectria ochroleuca TaxID=29856 RepID=A0ABY6UPB9_BIOOC|nr:unnamed protein product [Clonostachys rosea]